MQLDTPSHPNLDEKCVHKTLVARGVLLWVGKRMPGRAAASCSVPVNSEQCVPEVKQDVEEGSRSTKAPDCQTKTTRSAHCCGAVHGSVLRGGYTM